MIKLHLELNYLIIIIEKKEEVRQIFSAATIFSNFVNFLLTAANETQENI